MKHFIDGKRISWDTETTGLGVWVGDKPFAFSFTNEGGETKYFEFEVDPFTREPQADARILGKIKTLLEDPEIANVGHNIKFDIRMMERAYGIHTCGRIDDTLIMAHACNTLEPSLRLKYLGKKYADIGTEDQDQLKKCSNSLRRQAKKLGWKVGMKEQLRPDGTIKMESATEADYWLPFTMRRRHPDLVTEEQARLCEKYARLDAERTMMLYMFYDGLIEELEVRDMYENLELKLWPVIYAMETRGPCTDLTRINKQMNETRAEIARLTPIIQAASWPTFRPRNDTDFRKLAYDILKLPVKFWTAGGKNPDPEIRARKQKPAVNKMMIKDHLEVPVIRNIAIWRSNYTAYTTFFSKFKSLSIPDPFGGTTALHCDYRQVGPATGRLASGSPNLQNVMTPENTMAVHPIHCRTGFIPRPGYRWLCVDYDGMEIRMFAAVSEEPNMLRWIREGRSIHDEMTNTIWGGRNNEEAIKQAYRALNLDGTGIDPDSKVAVLWKEWGITEKDIDRIPLQKKYDMAEKWLASFDYNQVKAQATIGKRNSKTWIKALSFLKIYLGGPSKAQLILGGTVEEAAKVLAIYDELFPRIKEYGISLMKEARLNGFITSKWGRRLAINPELSYRAVNYMVQGSSADLMKQSLIESHRWLRKAKLDAHLLLTIHDEIVYEVARAELTYGFIKKVEDIMSDSMGHLSIRMPVEPKIVVNNWSIKQKVRTYE